MYHDREEKFDSQLLLSCFLSLGKQRHLSIFVCLSCHVNVDGKKIVVVNRTVGVCVSSIIISLP